MSIREKNIVVIEALRNCIAMSNGDVEKALENIQDTFGGKYFYMPKKFDKDRYSRIRQFHNGRNSIETMKEFGISYSTLYRALRTKNS